MHKIFDIDENYWTKIENESLKMITGNYDENNRCDLRPLADICQNDNVVIFGKCLQFTDSSIHRVQ